MAALAAAAAPLAAVATRDPTLTAVLRVLAAGFAINGTAVVANALLRRRLGFRTQFFIDICSYLAGYGVVTVALAWNGYGVWSLVCGNLVQMLVAAAALLAVVRHPVRPLLARRELADLLRYGIGAATSAWVNNFALSGDNFVVGRWAGVSNLGLYGRAYSLMNLPYTYTASVATTVLFPAFSETQGQEARLRRGYLLVTRLTAMIAGPAMALLAVAAPHLVPALYGARWAGAVAPLQVLCAAGYFRALYHLGGPVAQSVGWVYRELWRQLGYAVLVIVGAWAGLRYGLPGVAAGVDLAIVYMFLATGQLALRATGATWSDYLRVQFAAVATAAATGGAAFIVRRALDARGASDATAAAAVLIAGAVPWSIGLLMTLGEPGFERLRARLPDACDRLVDALRQRRARSSIT
jgi:PST family polysaccharide transporter